MCVCQTMYANAVKYETFLDNNTCAKSPLYHYSALSILMFWLTCLGWPEMHTFCVLIVMVFPVMTVFLVIVREEPSLLSRDLSMQLNTHQ